MSTLNYAETSGREETQKPENKSDFAASVIRKKIATGISRSQPI